MNQIQKVTGLVPGGISGSGSGLKETCRQQVRDSTKAEQHEQRDNYRLESAAEADQLMQRIKRPTGGETVCDNP